MLRTRVIPILLLKGGRMVKPVRFGEGQERDVGAPVTTARIYDSQDADELVFLDIEATADGRAFLLATLKEVAKNCFVPLTAGGGVRTLDDFREILKAGADKVSVNTAAVENPDLIAKAAAMFGAQAAEHGSALLAHNGNPNAGEICFSQASTRASVKSF